MYISTSGKNAVHIETTDKAVANTSANTKKETAANTTNRVKIGPAAAPARSASSLQKNDKGVAASKQADSREKNINTPEDGHDKKAVLLPVNHATATTANNNAIKKYKLTVAKNPPGIHKTPLTPGSFARALKGNGTNAPAEKPAAIADDVTTAEAIMPEKNNDAAAGLVSREGNSMKDNKIIPETAFIAEADSGIDNNVAVIAKAAIMDSAKNKNNTDRSSALAKTTAKYKLRKKLDWGVSFNAGAANISNGFSGIFSGTRSYDASAFYAGGLNSAASPPGNGATNNSNNARPSDVKSGFSFSGGIFIKKQLGNNFSLSAGLNYSYYSTHLDVGAKIDSNKALLQYNTGSSTSYTNRFHFIEIPVAIDKQLGKTSRFSLHGGLALSMLTGSNALLYNVQKNVYVADNSQINKWQFSLLAGASYRLFPKWVPVEIGPRFSYAVGNIFDKTQYGSRHLFFTGISARVFLSKK